MIHKLKEIELNEKLHQIQLNPFDKEDVVNDKWFAPFTQQDALFLNINISTVLNASRLGVGEFLLAWVVGGGSKIFASVIKFIDNVYRF